jgi:hypothetical protein
MGSAKVAAMPRGVAFLIAFLVLAAPASAAAPEPGVTPDSPAGKEYALPLNSARNPTGGAGSGGITPNGIVQAGTPFGVGIGPSARAAQGAGATTLKPNGKAIPLSPQERKKIQSLEADSGGMPLWMIALPIGIVLVAGLAGVGLALVTRRTGTT